MVYTRYILDLYMVYYIHIPELVLFKFCQLSKKQWMLEEVEMHVHTSGHKHNRTQKSCFTTRQDIPGIYQVYTMHIPCKSHMQAFLVAHLHLEASDRDFLRIFSVLATERPPTLGWGRPKFHNQVLI